MTYRSMKGTLAQAALLWLMLASPLLAQGEIVELEFLQISEVESDSARTVNSVVKVQGSGGLCPDGLYLVTHYGDLRELFETENQKSIDNPWKEQSWRYCTVFATAGDSGVFMGRNWDNQNVGSIIVSLYRPPGWYSSISFSRATDLGFPFNMDLEKIKQTELGARLLWAPFYVTDGINDQGLAIAVAGNREVTYEPQEGDRLTFITYLIRQVLDRAATVDEAVTLVEECVPFDLDTDRLNSHLQIVDSTGRSVVLEYGPEGWLKTYGESSWQVMSTRPVNGVPDSTLRAKCWRYRTLAGSLEEKGGEVAWHQGMAMLQDAAQKSTTWSAVYCSSTREVYFSVYQDWGTVYRILLQ